jgi:hypothetical protein
VYGSGNCPESAACEHSLDACWTLYPPPLVPGIIKRRDCIGREACPGRIAGVVGRAASTAAGAAAARGQAADQRDGAYSGANRINTHVDPSDPAGPLRPGSYPVIEGQRAYDRVISDYTRPFVPPFIMGEATKG